LIHAAHYAAKHHRSAWCLGSGDLIPCRAVYVLRSILPSLRTHCGSLSTSLSTSIRLDQMFVYLAWCSTVSDIVDRFGSDPLGIWSPRISSKRLKIGVIWPHKDCCELYPHHRPIYTLEYLAWCHTVSEIIDIWIQRLKVAPWKFEARGSHQKNYTPQRRL
jgi:hypothetical protein